MNYEKMLSNEKVGLKQTVKKIVKDIDKRLDTIENPSEDEEIEQPKE